MEKLTPLMQQYWEIKNQHTDKILLFRMGDFFEMFYDDAVKAAPILNIALTSRNKNQENNVPMCGVPHHSIGPQINKLLKAGLKVAICDQIENPQTMEGKIVKRAVTRVVTPGIVYDPENLESNSQNYVAALLPKANHFFDLAFVDASTGELLVSKNISAAQVILNVQKYLPKEVLLPVGYEIFFNLQSLITFRDFTKGQAVEEVLVTYVKETQGDEVLKTLRAPFAIKEKGLELNFTTIRHLEIFKKYDQEEKNTLFDSINLCSTPMGARLLKKRLLQPFFDKKEILEEQIKIDEAIIDQVKLKETKERLVQIGDLERKTVKLSSPLCNSRDVKALSNALKLTQEVMVLWPSFFSKTINVNQLNTLTAEVDKVLKEELPHATKEGGMINKGVSSLLDEYIELSTNAQTKLTELEEKERKNSGIQSLKIKFNNIFGYSFEITKANLDKIPSHFVRRQTLASAERFVTQELSDLEQKILAATQKRSELEYEIFNALRKKLLDQALDLLKLGENLAHLDLVLSFTRLALERNYCKPVFTETQILIKKSRHPVIETITDFVPNDIELQKGECLLLTGPNMAGKSTVMRQVALTALLAQIGSYVPAESAELPLFDKIFTRIGANDNLSQGQSTFMVEMTETAQIVREATTNSLVILDEIGRGTSTYDGLSLAHAILEHFVDNIKAYTFFATHYHELTEIASYKPAVKNAHMSIDEHKDQLVFLRRLAFGPANRSYGIEVAKLAGLPASLTLKASKILKDLTTKAQNIHTRQMSLLEQTWSEEKEIKKTDSATDAAYQLLLNEIDSFDTDKMTPLEALNQIYNLKNKVKSNDYH